MAIRVSGLVTLVCVAVFTGYIGYTLYVVHGLLVTRSLPAGVPAVVPALGGTEGDALQLHVFVSTSAKGSGGWGREGVAVDALASPPLANWSSGRIPFEAAAQGAGDTAAEAATREAMRAAGAGAVAFPVPEGVYAERGARDAGEGEAVYAHVYVTRWGSRPERVLLQAPDPDAEGSASEEAAAVANPAWNGETPLYRSARLSQWRAPPPATRRLLTSNATAAGLAAEVQRERRVAYLWPKLTLEIVHDFTRFNASERLPYTGEHRRVNRLSPGNPDRDASWEYQPAYRVGTFGARVDSLAGPLNASYVDPKGAGGAARDGQVWATLEVEVEPIGLAWFKFTEVMEASLEMQRKQFGGEEKESEDLKQMMTDTNPTLLLVSFVVAILHMLFDVLSFKNDIAFWRKRESLAGISGRAVMITALSRVVIYAYLTHEGANVLVRFSIVTGLLVDLWKIVGIIVPNMRRIARAKLRLGGGGPADDNGAATASVAADGAEEVQPSAIETLSDEIDALAFKWLSLALVPCVLAYFVYLLVAHEYPTWFSWFLNCVTALTYTFGFISMTPQLFMNYRLKSVESMPWRALTYKALNTFIDDLFAFIIAMPTMHRLGCFRDDIVFFVFLYQRWIYPKRTVAEGGGGDDGGSSKDAKRKTE